MQFSSSTKVNKPRIQFYDNAPSSKINLIDLETLSLDRLKVLKVVETAGQDFLKFSDKYDERIYSELNKLGGFGKIFTSTSTNPKNIEEDIKNDICSHFLLLVGHCHDENSKRWLIQQEVDLFRYRFIQETKASKNTDVIKKFLVSSKMFFDVITDSEKDEIRMQLISSCHNISVDSCKFFKVKFCEVPELVRSRRVFLKQGFAYVPDSELVSLVTLRFRINLSHNLAKMNLLVLPSIYNEENRILPILRSLSSKFIGEEYVPQSESTIKAANIDQHTKMFPLCMSQIYEQLRNVKHLRHHGRMQFGLFLKGIGISMEESLKFWKQAFSKVDHDTFNKQYAYNIRHNYGKEGKRVDYTPYSCLRIVNGTAPGGGDCHGCPFKHTDHEILKQRLSSKLSSDKVQTIIKHSQEKMFHMACREYFKATVLPTNASEDQLSSVPIINHPNQYFDLAHSLLVKGVLMDKNQNTPKQRVVVKKVKTAPKEDFDLNDADLSQIESSYIT